jgi:uridine kinase
VTKNLTVGISGGTGSGKTTITNRLIGALSEQSVVLVQQDHYYKDLSHLPFEERTKVNFDHPDSIETPLMIEQLTALREGRAVERPVYNFTEHRRVAKTVRVEPRPAILLEGILIFENADVRRLLDIKIFVDTDADIRFIRRLRRDVRERGRTVESVVEQYLNTVRPMHNEFIEPSKRYADIIIPEGGHNEVGIDLVIQKIKSLLPKN